MFNQMTNQKSTPFDNMFIIQQGNMKSANKTKDDSLDFFPKFYLEGIPNLELSHEQSFNLSTDKKYIQSW